MSEHILVCAPEPLPTLTPEGLLSRRTRYDVWLCRLPLTDPYYGSIAKVFSAQGTWRFLYALTDSPRYLHCDYLIGEMTAEAGVNDMAGDAAVAAFAKGLAACTRSWPTPYALHISDNPQGTTERRVTVQRDDLMLAIEAVTFNVLSLPDVLITVSP